jgi:hypothetical protein
VKLKEYLKTEKAKEMDLFIRQLKAICPFMGNEDDRDLTNADVITAVIHAFEAGISCGQCTMIKWIEEKKKELHGRN